MTDDRNDYFIESVPDGIANAVADLFPETECTGQDGYELLRVAFGKDVNGRSFKAFTDGHCAKLAKGINEWFDNLNRKASVEDARSIIEQAIRQWGG